MQPVAFNFHPLQGAVVKQLVSGRSNAFLVAGRGFGKSVCARGVINISAIDYQGPPLDPGVSKLFVCIAMPTLSQAKRIHWENLYYLYTQTELKHLVQGFDKSQGIIYLKGNRPSIMLTGVNDDLGDKIRGLSLHRLVFDEYQDIKPGVFAAAKPAVDRCNGRILIIGTPKGKSTFFYRQMLDLISSGKFAYHHYTTADNPTLPNLERLLEEAKIGLTEREYKSEILASWEDIPAAIFDHLDVNKHVTLLEKSPDDYDYCCLGVDWGDHSPSLVVVGIKSQPYPYRYYVLDAWNPNSSTTITFDELRNKALEFANKYQIYSTFADTHQPGNENFAYELSKAGHPGLARIALPGTDDYRKLRSMRVLAGCAQMNRLMKQDRFFINKDLTELVDDFTSYRRRQTRDGLVLDEPDRACRDHVIDCTRYVVASIDETLRLRYGLGEAVYSAFGEAA